MNRRQLLRLAPCVLGLAAFRPRVDAEVQLIDITPSGDGSVRQYMYVRRSKPGIDSLEGSGLHPDDIERI